MSAEFVLHEQARDCFENNTDELVLGGEKSSVRHLFQILENHVVTGVVVSWEEAFLSRILTATQSTHSLDNLRFHSSRESFDLAKTQLWKKILLRLFVEEKIF